MDFRRIHEKRSRRRTRIARMTRIHTDGGIREYPLNLCHPCSLPPQHRLIAVVGAGDEAAPVEARAGRGLGIGERGAQVVLDGIVLVYFINFWLRSLYSLKYSNITEFFGTIILRFLHTFFYKRKEIFSTFLSKIK